MKKIYTFIAAVLLAATSFSQAPEKMSYQAVVRNSGDNLVVSQTLGVQISILKNTATGTAVYVETQTPTTNVNGLVTLEIGTGITSDDFTAIDWSTGPYFIKTETDPTGGVNYTITGTSQLMSVPYALQAKTATNGLPSGGTEEQILQIINGVATWADAASTNAYYEDADGDGYGNINTLFLATLAPNGYVTDNTDCDDTDSDKFPGQTWYIDADGDGYGVSSAISCERPTNGFLVSELSGTGTDDCDDTDSDEFPGQTWYIDADGDGYGVSSTISCERPTNGFILSELSGTGTDDCDDLEASINPGASEIFGNNVDNNCNGEIDEMEIGQIHEGGIIFYIFQDGDTGYIVGEIHGLVCAVEDQSSGIRWHNGSNLTTGATETAITTGASNTDAIISVQGATETNYAAGLARAYNGGSFNDWFLPSKDELNEMYQNKATIEVTATSNGGSSFDTSNFYWSSTENQINSAWSQSLDTGAQSPNVKKYIAWVVRAVRAF
ncbi:MopE-related protein [Lacinutrix sp. Bg11-31]|uniref:MopE-related protein n=1 Tax=Lacinutrix sp. Bg11-31 TaxID=2057808 RepID=UPI000C31524C|nr:MopE-related protein [Lacinutrix sp. Bg11-31]AUC81948.1 hypothetical protein CW733_07315 [Lacinutrix sp. Bg11-31]